MHPRAKRRTFWALLWSLLVVVSAPPRTDCGLDEGIDDLACDAFAPCGG